MLGEAHMTTLEDRANVGRFFHFESDREVLELFRPTPNVVLFRILGHMTGAAADKAAQALEAELGGAPIVMFVDMMAMTAYEPRARRGLSDWVVQHPEQIEHAWFCTANKVVEMGISVGSMIVAMAGVRVDLVSHEQWLEELQQKLDA